MRGKGSIKNCPSKQNRITPAHAGKRQHLRALFLLDQDHPRPCGEKEADTMNKQNKQGSPPPMRGKAPGYALAA